MIRLENILTPGRSIIDAPGGSKQDVLQSIAQLFLADLPGLSSDVVFENLLGREKLGSTGFGNGIAIPHCRLPGCKTPLSAVLKLKRPIDFDANDGQPVDLLFVLLVPQEATSEHLELLSQIAGMLDRTDVRERLRQADSNQALYSIVVAVQNGG